MDHETKHMLYEPGERIDEYWNIQFQYLVDDGMITTEEEKAYFQSSEYRDVLKGHMSRTPDKLHMIYFVREGDSDRRKNAFMRSLSIPEKMARSIML